MQYLVFVQSHPDKKFVASVVGMPIYDIKGNTREEAIANAKAALEAQLANGELVPIEVNLKNGSSEETPNKKYMGIFADDPTFDNFMEKLAAIRQQANAMDNLGAKRLDPYLSQKNHPTA